ncbi:hypothetical protein FK220_014155 [Flavobacteriaceae bacterium TP-CH-4]|uniref:Uncharacterized protein n=1 Tax=Pelagihabitans pacificus TaxID=2696054 RepID=A0A967AU87_9FLAO|nr:hypothetical protein [Pelagihabitans pacificus]NHF60494.1 hypothetical protein [Pelagihabitans pacificus]
MENLSLRGRILSEIESLVAQSFPKQKVPQNVEKLHVALVKKHYNAADVSIDYHRRRVEMDIVMDDRAYDPTKVNTDLPTLHANLWFRNLSDFLKSCLDKDNRSLAFYASLLKSYRNNDMIVVA